MTIEEIRAEFPQLREKVYGKSLVYLDNAATSLRPECVVRTWCDSATRRNANLHRAVHYMANIATKDFEAARDAVQETISAEHREEVIFTAGATSASNLLAFSFGEIFVSDGDEIIVSESDHHSNILPWQLLCRRKGAALKVLPVDDNGRLEISKLRTLISERTRLVCIPHISNVLGLVNPVRKIADICHSAGVPLLVDGAQGIVHEVVNVKDLGCDFYFFSGHKVYAAPGTGVLYGRKELLDVMPPFMSGGEMIGTVKWEGSTFAPLPQKFEAGTQNISAIPTLVPALSLAARMRNVESESGVCQYMLDRLLSDPRITLYGIPDEEQKKVSLFSFCVEDVHHEDLALVLDKMGFAVRSGQMCAEPLMDRFGVQGMLRASFAPYNTLSEAEAFIGALDKAINMLLG